MQVLNNCIDKAVRKNGLRYGSDWQVTCQQPWTDYVPKYTLSPVGLFHFIMLTRSNEADVLRSYFWRQREEMIKAYTILSREVEFLQNEVYVNFLVLYSFRLNS